MSRSPEELRLLLESFCQSMVVLYALAKKINSLFWNFNITSNNEIHLKKSEYRNPKSETNPKSK